MERKGSESMSALTKRALLKALGTLLERKPFKKITVTDLTEECGISRMTFYYHFKDIYDMLEWALEKSLKDAFKDPGEEYPDWKQGYLAVFRFALNYKSYAQRILPDMDSREMQKYLHGFIYRLVRETVDAVARDRAVSEEERSFIAENCTYSAVGTLLKWGFGGMKESPEEIVARYAVLFDGFVAASVDKFEEARKSKQSS